MRFYERRKIYLLIFYYPYSPGPVIINVQKRAEAENLRLIGAEAPRRRGLTADSRANAEEYTLVCVQIFKKKD
ncbi:MAG: hypothetical protein ABJA37_14925 [Ferruginibacter sp.]